MEECRRDAPMRYIKGTFPTKTATITLQSTPVTNLHKEKSDSNRSDGQISRPGETYIGSIRTMVLIGEYPI